jgi:hypothetical protein
MNPLEQLTAASMQNYEERQMQERQMQECLMHDIQRIQASVNDLYRSGIEEIVGKRLQQEMEDIQKYLNNIDLVKVISEVLASEFVRQIVAGRLLGEQTAKPDPYYHPAQARMAGLGQVGMGQAASTMASNLSGLQSTLYPPTAGKKK